MKNGNTLKPDAHTVLFSQAMKYLWSNALGLPLWRQFYFRPTDLPCAEFHTVLSYHSGPPSHHDLTTTSGHKVVWDWDGIVVGYRKSSGSTTLQHFH